MKTIRLLFLFFFSISITAVHAQDEAGDPTVGTLPLLEKIPSEDIEHVEIIPVDNPIINCNSNGTVRFKWKVCVTAANATKASAKMKEWMENNEDNFFLKIIFWTQIKCIGCALPGIEGCNPVIKGYELTKGRATRKDNGKYSITITAKIKGFCTKCEG